MIELYLGCFILLSTIILGRSGLSYEAMYIYTGATIFFAIYFVTGINSEYLEGIALSSVLVLVGMLAGSVIAPRARNHISPLNEFGQDQTILWVAAGVVLTLALLHFSIVGVPLLSDDIEVERFMSASSGFGGVPSRITTYGPIFVVLLAGLLWKSRMLSFGRAITFLIVFSLLIVAQGHKSSVLQLLIISIIAGAFPRLRLSSFARIAPILIVSLASGYVVFARMDVFNQYDYFTYLQERLSYIMLESGYELYNKKEFGGFDIRYGSPILNDFMYPFARLFGSSIETLNTQLSRDIYRVTDGDFTVPVTPAFFSYHYYAFNELAAHSFSLLFGVLCAWVQKLAYSARTQSSAASMFFVQYWLYVGYSSGNMYYLIPNTALALAILLIPTKIYLSSRRLSNG